MLGHSYGRESTILPANMADSYLPIHDRSYVIPTMQHVWHILYLFHLRQKRKTLKCWQNHVTTLTHVPPWEHHQFFLLINYKYWYRRDKMFEIFLDTSGSKYRVAFPGETQRFFRRCPSKTSFHAIFTRCNLYSPSLGQNRLRRVVEYKSCGPPKRPGFNSVDASGRRGRGEGGWSKQDGSIGDNLKFSGRFWISVWEMFFILTLRGFVIRKIRE